MFLPQMTIFLFPEESFFLKNENYEEGKFHDSYYTPVTLSKIYRKKTFTFLTVLILAGVEFNFSIVAYIGQCFGFVQKIVLITH